MCSRDTTRLGHCYALYDIGGYKFFVLECWSGNRWRSDCQKRRRGAGRGRANRRTGDAGLAGLHARGRRAWRDLARRASGSTARGKTVEFSLVARPLGRSARFGQRSAAPRILAAERTRGEAGHAGRRYLRAGLRSSISCSPTVAVSRTDAAALARPRCAGFAPLDPVAVGVTPALTVSLRGCSPRSGGSLCRRGRTGPELWRHRGRSRHGGVAPPARCGRARRSQPAAIADDRDCHADGPLARLLPQRNPRRLRRSATRIQRLRIDAPRIQSPPTRRRASPAWLD